MTETPHTETDTDVVIIGDLAAPTLRLVSDNARDTDTVAQVQPMTPDPPARRHSHVQWLSLVFTLAAIGTLSLFIVLFDPPTLLAGTALAGVVVIGALLICAELVTEVANRRHPYGDMTPHHRNEDVLADGFDVQTLGFGD